MMIPVPQPVLESLARSFGTFAADLSHFGGGREESDGVIYVYPYHGSRRLLKIMALAADDQRGGRYRLEERLRFMRFLGENGAPIAFPRLSPRGNLYETFLFESYLWVGYGMEIVPGESVAAHAWNPGFFRNWGQTIGMLHRLARQYPSWESSVDPETGKEILTWYEEWDVFYHWCQDEDVKQKWVEIRQQLEALPKTRDVYGFIHNDPHIWNLLVDGDHITLLDFDVANHHWFINDMAIACQSVLYALSGGLGGTVHGRNKLHGFLSFFLEGYEREHHLSSEWLNRLDLFIAYRRVLLFTVMYGWIQSQPEAHTTWKQMILDQPEVAGTLRPT
jgi:Ser/Thr protein kinase RdoA (MazF antagonist)